MSGANDYYRCYFNAFDEYCQQPKHPDSICLKSVGLKVKDTFVLKCSNKYLRPYAADEDTKPLDGNIFIYFHPGLCQNFYVMAYNEQCMSLDNPFSRGDYQSNLHCCVTEAVIRGEHRDNLDPVFHSGVGGHDPVTEFLWGILKVGNNGTPFKLNQYFKPEPPNSFKANAWEFGEIALQNLNNERYRAGRVVSSAMRITNVGLTVADVLEIKVDPRLETHAWGCRFNPITFGYPDFPFDLESVRGDEQVLYGGYYTTNSNVWQIHSDENYPRSYEPSGDEYMMCFFDPAFAQDHDTCLYYSNRYHPYPETFNNLLNGSIDWEDAVYHSVIPTGSLSNGVQINAVPLKDDREFIEFTDDMTAGRHMVLKKETLPNIKYLATNQSGYTYGYGSQSRLINDVHGERLYNFICDKDFLGTYIQITRPTLNLELLIEVVTNYELLCHSDSPLYSFQTYVPKLNVEIKDVRDVVEKMYGKTCIWDVSQAEEVSKTIDTYLQNSRVLGSTTGVITSDTGMVSMRDGMLDNGVLKPFKDPMDKPAGGGEDERNVHGHGDNHEEDEDDNLNRIGRLSSLNDAYNNSGFYNNNSNGRGTTLGRRQRRSYLDDPGSVNSNLSGDRYTKRRRNDFIGSLGNPSYFY